ncbi:MAG TPA: hypothetical protein PKY30_17495, partial [Myxococcota bacterium]|nr:hypothetical protein [Myxococcota bacterium]
RSLYKERGQGHTPDQGRIVLGLVAAGAIPERQRYSARFKAKHLLSWAWSAWWPHKLQADLEGSQTAFQRGSQWVHIASPGLLVPQDTVGIFVGVYGKHNANYDTDAYFDNIRVQWWRELIPGSGT